MSAPMHICPCEYLLVRAIKSRGLWDLVPQTAAQLRRYFLGFRREASPTLQYYNPLAYAAGCLVHLRLDLAHIRPVTAPDPGGCPTPLSAFHFPNLNQRKTHDQAQASHSTHPNRSYRRRTL